MIKTFCRTIVNFFFIKKTMPFNNSCKVRFYICKQLNHTIVKIKFKSCYKEGKECVKTKLL